MATPSFRIKLRLPPKEDGAEGVVATPGEDDGSDAGGPQSGSDGGNDDEMDELVDEDDEEAPLSSVTGTPVHNGGNKGGSARQPSASSKARVGSESMPGSPGESPSATGKRSIATQDLSLAELDALPAAKRRRAHQARGASGPGRGWRKGLKMGQKPVYQPSPTPFTPENSSTPASFGHSRPASSSRAKSNSASGPSTKATAAAAGTSSTSTPAKRLKQFKYPPISPFRPNAPLIKPIARHPQVMTSTTPLDRTSEAAKKPVRRWTQRRREIMSIGGRPWGIMMWFGDGGEGDAAATASSESKADASTTQARAEGGPVADAASTPGGTPAPSTPAPGGGAERQRDQPPTGSIITGTRVSSVKKERSGPSKSRGSVSRSRGGYGNVGTGASASSSRATGDGAGQRAGSVSVSVSAKSSPLANIVPLPGASTPSQPIGDWRGSSPAFFAGARKGL